MQIGKTSNAIANHKPNFAMAHNMSDATDEECSRDTSKCHRYQKKNTSNKLNVDGTVEDDDSDTREKNTSNIDGTIEDDDSDTRAKVHHKGKKESHRRHHRPPAQVLSDGTRVTKYKKSKTLADGVVVTKAVAKTVYPTPVTGDERSSPPNPHLVLKKVKTKIKKKSPDGECLITTTIEETIRTNDNSLDPGIAIQRTEHSSILPDGSELTTINQLKRLADGTLSDSITRVHTIAKETEAIKPQTNATPSTVQSQNVIQIEDKGGVQAEFDTSFSIMGSPELLLDEDCAKSSNISSVFEKACADEVAQRRNIGARGCVEDDPNDKQNAKRSMSLQSRGVGAHLIIPSGNGDEEKSRKESIDSQRRRSMEALETCSEEPLPMELLQEKILSIPTRGVTYPPEFVDNDDHNKGVATKTKSHKHPHSTVVQAMGSYDEEPIPMDFVRCASVQGTDSQPGGGVRSHVMSMLKFNSQRIPKREKNDDIQSHFWFARDNKQGLLSKSKHSASPQKSSSIDLKDQSKRDQSSIDIIEDSPSPGQRYSTDGLAVATRVDPSEDNEPIFAAIEYDPSSKPPIYKNRRCRLYTSLSLLLTTIIIALVVIYSTKKGKEEVVRQEVTYITEAPTSPPTTDREALGIQKMIQDNVLQRNATFHGMKRDDPRWLALDWILHKDGMQLGKNDLNLYQRYVLALLAFQFDSLAWSSCGGNYSVGKMADNATCTIDNENTTDTTEEYVQWLTSVHECSWYGVACLDGKVRSLQLPQNNLIGQIPPEISVLRFIDVLKLNDNCLVGTLPYEMGLMINLQQLNLEYNGLSGYLPDEFYNMSSLTHIYLAGQSGNDWNCTSSNGETIQLYFNSSGDINNGLEGRILQKIGRFRHLKAMLVDYNYFSGTITPDIKNLKQLEILSGEYNAFSGTIPEEISEMVNLKEIWFGGNWLSGSLPENIGQAKALEVISLYGTETSQGYMTGTLPDSLYNLTNLKELYLFSNHFEGVIKTDIGNLKDLTRLLIADNQFTGTLPSELGSCEKLEWVQIDHNQIEGTVPEEVCALRNKNLYSENPGSDEYLKADCMKDLETGVEFIQCDCCSVCCNHTTNECINNET